MLTFSKEGKNTRPIAIVKGGKYDNEIIYVNSDMTSNDTLLDDYEDFAAEYEGEYKRLPRNVKQLKIMKEISKYEGKRLTKDVFNKIVDKTDEEMDHIIGNGKMFVLNPLANSKLELLPNIKRNDIIVAFGDSGAGKSYFANQFAEKFRSVYPDSPIYIISRIEKDDSIKEEKVGIDRILLNIEFLSFPFELSMIKGSLVIIDDIEGIEDMFMEYGKQGEKLGQLMLKKIKKIQNDIIHMGRSHDRSVEENGVSIFNIKHEMNDRSKTKILLNGSQSFILFPQFLNADHVLDFMKKQMGVDKELREKLMKERWFLFNRNSPKYVMGEKFIYLL